MVTTQISIDGLARPWSAPDSGLQLSHSSHRFSVEFAALQFHTRLVVVLGHCRCVAILTALRQLTHPHEKVTSNQEVLMNYIRPAVEPLLTPDADSDDPDLVETAVRLNVAHSIGLLRGSTGLHRLMDSGDLMVVGAEYSMDTGVVEFFENTPSA